MTTTKQHRNFFEGRHRSHANTLKSKKWTSDGRKDKHEGLTQASWCTFPLGRVDAHAGLA